MRLFNVNKIGVFCDGIKHHNETRTSGDVKVITLACRVDTFDHKLATALDRVVRATLFKLNHPEPQPHIKRCEFALGVERQTMEIFASSDTSKASIAFDQVKIGRVSARTKKDATGYALTFDATFGPVGDKELAYVEAWRGTQRAVTFEPAEPNLEFEDERGGGDEELEEDEEPAAPMFDTDPSGRPQ